MAAYLASLLLAFLIGFFFEVCIGTIGFWFLEVTSLLYVVNTLNFFVSGHMFPLDLLPPFWAGLLKLLPFQYLAYFPAAVFLGKVEGARTWCKGCLLEAAWALGLFVLARVLFREDCAGTARMEVEHRRPYSLSYFPILLPCYFPFLWHTSPGEAVRIPPPLSGPCPAS